MFLGTDRPPESLSMSSLEPLHAFDNTIVILEVNFFSIGHPGTATHYFVVPSLVTFIRASGFSFI